MYTHKKYIYVQNSDVLFTDTKYMSLILIKFGVNGV